MSADLVGPPPEADVPVPASGDGRAGQEGRERRVQVTLQPGDHEARRGARAIDLLLNAGDAEPGRG